MEKQFDRKSKVLAVALAAAIFGGGFLLGTQWNGTSEIPASSEGDQAPTEAPHSEPDNTDITTPPQRAPAPFTSIGEADYWEGPIVSHGVSFFSLRWGYGERELAIPMPNYATGKSWGIYQTLWEAHQWIPESFCDYKIYFPTVTYASDRYFSNKLYFQSPGNRVFHYDYCTLLDIESGDILYLDDLVDVEGLAELALTSGYLRFPPGSSDKLPEGFFPQTELDNHSLEEVLATLDKCSEPYTEENYGRKPTFYLTPGRLHILNLFGPYWNEDRGYYFELDDIEHLLKVDRW